MEAKKASSKKATTSTVYHGCNISSVKKIKQEIVISDGTEGDFNRPDKGRAFYTTKDQHFAEYWAIKSHKADAAVIQLTVDLNGLKVTEFQTAKTDTDLGEWQTFVFNNWENRKLKKGSQNTISDVVTGFVSNADELKWDDEDNPVKGYMLKPLTLKALGAATQVAFCSNRALDEPYCKFVSYKKWKAGKDGEDGEWLGYGKAI